jgi:hypothetical protein
MALHRDGNGEDARQRLTQAMEAAKTGAADRSWQTRQFGELLQKEAEATLSGKGK